MILKEHRRPKDRLLVERGRGHVIPSERFWQGGWMTRDGHEITGWVDLHLTERLTVERPVVREAGR